MPVKKKEPMFLGFIKRRCMRKFLAETMGVIILILAAVLTKTWMQPLGVSFLMYSLIVIGLGIVIQPISGCHLNPAVSLGEAYDGEIYVRCSFKYMLFQIVGALLAGFILWFLTSSAFYYAESYAAYGNYYIPYPPRLVEYNEGIWAMLHIPLLVFVLTFIFVFLVAGAVGRYGKNRIIGVTIGLSLVLEHAVAVLIRGASVNPIINVGIAIQFAFFGLEHTARGTDYAGAHWFYPLRDLWAYLGPALLAGYLAGRIGRPLFANNHFAEAPTESVLHQCHAWGYYEDKVYTKEGVFSKDKDGNESKIEENIEKLAESSENNKNLIEPQTCGAKCSGSCGGCG
ncbi:MAG: aquaporin [Firmicutes bacterium]|nr:aquaporin [Bacillota bacterium]